MNENDRIIHMLRNQSISIEKIMYMFRNQSIAIKHLTKTTKAILNDMHYLLGSHNNNNKPAEFHIQNSYNHTYPKTKPLNKLSKRLQQESMDSTWLYDHYRYLNKQNYKSLLLTAMNTAPLTSKAKKEANIKSIKTATLNQTKLFFRIILYHITKDLGGQMHINGDGAINFPNYDGIKGIDGKDYFTRFTDDKHFLSSKSPQLG